MCFLRREEVEINRLREDYRGATLRDLFRNACGSDCQHRFRELVQRQRDGGQLYVNCVLAPEVIERAFPRQDAWSNLREYCAREFGDAIVVPFVVADCILIVLRPTSAGVSIDRGAVRQSEPRLQFDDDGLLIGPPEIIEFRSDGVLTQRHWLRYHQDMPGAGVTGGFVDSLLEARARLDPVRFGFALHDDVVFQRELHQPITTRAHIRGPRGITTKFLRESNFPESPRGTVTVHQRLEPHPLHDLFPLDRVEVMWSRKGSRKTIQIEELRLPVTTSTMKNRYIHAIWDGSVTAFVHFDGAMRAHDVASYRSRLARDIKSCPRKSSSYTKLFRIDARIDVRVWSDLVTKFFEQNELVLEYLEDVGRERGSIHSCG